MSEQQAQGADEAIDLNNELKARRITADSGGVIFIIPIAEER